MLSPPFSSSSAASTGVSSPSPSLTSSRGFAAGWSSARRTPRAGSSMASSDWRPSTASDRCSPHPGGRACGPPRPAPADHQSRNEGVEMTKLISVLALFAVVLSVAAGTATARTYDDANIVQTAVAAGQFKTLAMLLTRAGLVGALQEAGPYTVFAPTDAAFKKVPKKTLNALLRNKAKLKAVLLYHVVSGNVPSTAVVKLATAKTLSGKSVRIRTSGMNVFVNSAKVTKADVTASNGVIHVINRVLIPPAR